MYIYVEYSLHETNVNIPVDDQESIFYISNKGVGMSLHNKKTGNYCRIVKLAIYNSNDKKIIEKCSNQYSLPGYIAGYEVIECLLFAAKTIATEHNVFSIIQRPVFIVCNERLIIDILHYIITNLMINDVWCNEWKCVPKAKDKIKIILWTFTNLSDWMEAKRLFKTAIVHNSQLKYSLSHTTNLSQLNFCKLQDILPSYYKNVSREKRHAHIINRHRQPIVIKPRIYVNFNPQDEFGTNITTQYNNCLKVFNR